MAELGQEDTYRKKLLLKAPRRGEKLYHFAPLRLTESVSRQNKYESAAIQVQLESAGCRDRSGTHLVNSPPPKAVSTAPKQKSVKPTWVVSENKLTRIFKNDWSHYTQ